VVFEKQLSRYPGLLSFSADGSRLAIVVQGDPVQIVAADGSPVTTLESALGGTWAIAFSRDNARIAAGGGDGRVRIHDARSGALLAENRDLLMTVLAVAFTADGSSVIVGSGDKVLTFVDAATGQATRRLERTAQPVSFIDVSPDGRLMATMFMKTESMLEPDHVLVTDIESGDTQVDWLPSALPAGGGWTSDGRLTVGVPAPDGLKLWRVR
jgi:tricorn protease-like protein